MREALLYLIIASWLATLAVAYTATEDIVAALESDE